MTCSPIGWIAENLERTQGPKIGNQLFILGVQIHRKYKCKEYTQLVFHVESCHVTCQLLSVFLPKYRCELLCVQWSLLQRLSATVQAYSIWLLSAQKKYMIWHKKIHDLVQIWHGHNHHCDYDYDWLWKQSKIPGIIFGWCIMFSSVWLFFVHSKNDFEMHGPLPPCSRWVGIHHLRQTCWATVTRSATRQRYCWMPQTVSFSSVDKLWVRFQEKHDQLVNWRELFEPTDLQDSNWQCNEDRGHNSSSLKASAKSYLQKWQTQN